MNRDAPRLLVVLGQTGTGKSALAVELALRLGGEIVGCDAFQVYRGLDVATAKPTPDERRAVPHHLVDCVEPSATFSAAAYAEAADRAIAAIASRGKVPVVVGGTGLYLRALLQGLIDAPARDRAVQARLSRIAERGGAERLHRLLSRHDPASAARIAPRDRQRIVRAVELLAGGTTWSRLLDEESRSAATAPRHATLKVGLEADPDWLLPRLEARVDRFLAAGLEAELRGLLAAGLSREANALKAIGYREMLAALEREDRTGVREAIVRSTRRYAKRQRTWFRREPDVVWLPAAAERDANAARVEALWRGDASD